MEIVLGHRLPSVEGSERIEFGHWGRVQAWLSSRVGASRTNSSPIERVTVRPLSAAPTSTRTEAALELVSEEVFEAHPASSSATIVAPTALFIRAPSPFQGAPKVPPYSS